MNSNNVMVTNYRLLSSFSQEEKNDDMSRRRRNTAIKGMIKPINFKEINVILEQDSRT
jgi:hypothetical protein